MNTKQVLILRKTDKLHYIKLCTHLCCRREVKRRGQRTTPGLFSQKTMCNLGNQTQIFPLGGKHLYSLDHFIIPKMNSFWWQENKEQVLKGQATQSEQNLCLSDSYPEYKSVRHSPQEQRDNKWPTRHFTEEDIQINYKDMKIYSSILNQLTKMLD